MYINTYVLIDQLEKYLITYVCNILLTIFFDQ